MDFRFIHNIEQKQNVAVVLAASFGALAVVRALGRHGVPVVVLGNPDYIGRSKYCIDVKIKDPEDIVHFLKAFPRHIQSKPVLFTDNEDHLQLIYEHWDVLSKVYALPVALNNRRLTDKYRLYEYALKAGIKAPVTYIGGEQRRVQEFPVIVKPINDDELWRTSGLKYQKVYECRNRRELIDTLDTLKRYNCNSVTQQIIPGDVTNLYCVTLYRNQLGRIVTGFVVQKLKQYPMDYGTGTIHVTSHQKKLVADSIRLLEAADYTGIAMIEYKYDKRSKQFYIIEVNGRFPVETGIEKKLGNDFVYRIYKDLLNPAKGNELHISTVKPVLWIYFLNNLKTMTQKGSYRMKDMWRLVGKCQIQFALWDWDDPIPSVYFPKYVCQRLFRGRRVVHEQT